ncbi:UNVERIFIED_CONTAM: hypothetical protein PYX00_010789 [Menopon gallinae]|uniref:Origin recognition complex subunit 2 n=1 Tax=Menopon gallinae TaxID=328185 RepID=A0AAW2HH44_9NEOP
MEEKVSKSRYKVKGRNEMKTMNVVFVSDELVGEIMVSRKEYERAMRQKVKAEMEKSKMEDEEMVIQGKVKKRKTSEETGLANSKKSKYIDDVELALAALENDDVEKLAVYHPTTLFDEEKDVSANKIYKFQNHAPRAAKTALTSPATPKDANTKKESETPKSKIRLTAIEEEKTVTPYTLRKRVIKDMKKIQRILENSDDDDDDDDDRDFSASESEYSESSEESAAEENDAETVKKKPINYRGAGSNYFEAQSVKRNITSNNTLKKLKNPKLDQQELNSIVSGLTVSEAHRNGIKSLIGECVSLFPKWDFILQQNFNLLLYGVGSKKEIVKKFVERFAKKHPVIVVNGYFPDVTVREITDKVCQILKIDSNISDVLEETRRKMSEYNIKIYLAMNNIDGIMLRNKKSQTVLSQFAKIERIHVIATIDHINAPLMWDKSTNSDFNWIWFDSTTFLNYAEEVVYEGNIMLHNSGQLTLSSLRSVYNSLTKNSRGIFLLIVKRELESESAKKKGISFRELYQACRKELLISSDVALRSQLKEFIDHAILKQKRNSEGEEKFVISIENNILKQFLDDQERC